MYDLIYVVLSSVYVPCAHFKLPTTSIRKVEGMHM